MKQDCSTLQDLLTQLTAIPLRFPGPKDRADGWKPALQAINKKCVLIIHFGDKHVRLSRESNEQYVAAFEARAQAMHLRILCQKARRLREPIALAALLGEIRQQLEDLAAQLRHICLLLIPDLAPAVALALPTV